MVEGRWIMRAIALVVCLVATTPSIAQLRVEGDVQVLVTRVPFKLVAPSGAKMYLWRIPPSWEADYSVKSNEATVAVATEGASLVVVEAISAAFEVTTYKLTVNVGKPPPTRGPSIRPLASAPGAGFPDERDPMVSPVPMPEGARRYDKDAHTQTVLLSSGRYQVFKSPRTGLAARWLVPGGLFRVKGWTGERWKYVPAGTVERVGAFTATTPAGTRVRLPMLVRSYPDGTRFDEVLRSDRGVFEHRVRIKKDGTWKGFVAFRNADAFPVGYTGLTRSCKSCHDEAGTGGYGKGFVPGSDTVLSDPLPWHLVGG